jgi:hypothetical protein
MADLQVAGIVASVWWAGRVGTGSKPFLCCFTLLQLLPFWLQHASDALLQLLLLLLQLLLGLLLLALLLL